MVKGSDRSQGRANSIRNQVPQCSIEAGLQSAEIDAGDRGAIVSVLFTIYHLAPFCFFS